MDLLSNSLPPAIEDIIALSSLSFYISTSTFFYYIGAFVVAVFTAYFINCLVWQPFKLYFIARLLPGIDFKKLGRWAVVTGATSGIGKEYAKALANRGLHIILISRSQDKLSTVAEDIKNKYDVQVQTIAVDFTRTDIYNKIEKSLEGLDIAILVNNVGVGHEQATFLKVENFPQCYTDMVNVNCMAITRMCAIVLPQMVDKSRGVIVNVSSISCVGYVTQATYSASKAYISMLSGCLHRAYRKSGIIVQTLEPGMVQTNLLATNYSKYISNGGILLQLSRYLTIVSAESYVASAISTIGWAAKCNGNLFHFILSFVISCCPVWYQDVALLELAVK